MKSSFVFLEYFLLIKKKNEYILASMLEVQMCVLSFDLNETFYNFSAF